MVTENGIHLPPMKVISNTILFVYSLRGALIKIARGCYTWWRNYFDGTTPLTAISTPWGRGWEVHQPTAWPVPNHPGASLLGIIKIWNISKSTTTNQSAWYNRLICEPRTLAHGIVSILRARLFYLTSRNWRVVDYFHIWDRASIPGHARTIFCVHLKLTVGFSTHIPHVLVSLHSWSTRYCYR